MANRGGGGLGSASYEMLGTMAQPGCPVCRYTEGAVRRFLEATAYEMVNDVGVRQELRDAFGFCAPHGQQWQELQNSLATAIIYTDVLTQVLRAIEGQYGAGAAESNGGGFLGRLQARRGGAGAGLAAALEPSGACIACRFSLTAERETIDAFVGGLDNAQFFATFEGNETGLCLPHFRAVLRRLASPDLAARLARSQQAHLLRTHAELAEVIRKNDYRFTDEEKGPEFAAPARAVQQAAGILPTQINFPK